MAPKSTMFKVSLSVADITRNYYEDHTLTIARHPSETDLRMMIRVIAFALNAHEHMMCGKGLSSTEEPDLWQKDLTGAISHWIDLGQPAEKRIRQACGKSDKVSIYTYQKGAAIPWFEDVKSRIERFEHLRVVHLVVVDESLVERLLERTMRLNCTIEDDQVMLADDTTNMVVDIKVAKDFQ
jgi:uncharacterized protein YaeQ